MLNNNSFLSVADINNCMSDPVIIKPRKKSPTRGGARPRAGRPVGSTNKITVERLLATIEQHIGMPFEQSIATSYRGAIDRGDWSLVHQYEKLILAKTIADRHTVEIFNNEDELERKQAAFREALATLTIQQAQQRARENGEIDSK